MTADSSGQRVTIARDLADDAGRELIEAGATIAALTARVEELEAAVAAFAVVGFGVVVLAVLWALGRVAVIVGGVL